MSWKTIENAFFLFEQNDELAKLHFEIAGKKPPKELFHYTSSEGLMAMIESQFVYATERSFLNDPREFKWGAELFGEFIEKTVNQNYPKDLISLLRDALRGKIDDDLRLFVFSLSANPDLLSQWRAYASDAAGFALGFDGQTLRERSGFGEQVLKKFDLEKMQSGFCYCYHLLPVIYEKHEQLEVIQRFFTAAANFWNQFEDQKDFSSRQLFRMLVQHRMKEFIISFKNPGFKEESEWRIVVTVHKANPDIKFRNGRFGITPYVKLNLSPYNVLPDLKLKLSSIWVGPRSPAIQNRRGLEMFLASKKIDVGICFSETDYRS
jgi:hypothetical protein